MQFNFKTFLSLIRALFPRWNFFDETGFNYEIHYLLPEHNTWKKIDFAHRQKFYHLFLNPTFNETLAEFNIVEHFARDIQEHEHQEIATSSKTSFKLFLSLMKLKLKWIGKDPSRIQIKLLARNSSEMIVVYHSPWTSMEMV